MKERIRAQAALEFLMTYGWMIVTVLVAISALAYFGVLSPDNFFPRKCFLQSGIGCTDFKVNENSAIIVLRNGLGEDITITRINVGNCTISDAGILSNTEQKSFTMAGCVNAASSKFSRKINITYTGLSGLVHVNQGSITDRVESGTSEAGGPETIELTIDSDTLNYNIFEEAGSPAEAVTVTLTIFSGATVGSSSASTAALATGSFVEGSSITITNDGVIAGAGGTGGSGNPRQWEDGRDGQDGGDAILVTVPISIENNGIIGSGGGGGGGGYKCADYECYDDPGGGGGGGSGYIPGIAGICGSNPTGGTGGDASQENYNGGSGGSPCNPGGEGGEGSGVSGGNLGEPGTTMDGNAIGGLAGAAVSGNSLVTWTLAGDIRGDLE